MSGSIEESLKLELKYAISISTSFSLRMTFEDYLKSKIKSSRVAKNKLLRIICTFQDSILNHYSVIVWNVSTDNQVVDCIVGSYNEAITDIVYILRTILDNYDERIPIKKFLRDVDASLYNRVHIDSSKINIKRQADLRKEGLL